MRGKMRGASFAIQPTISQAFADALLKLPWLSASQTIDTPNSSQTSSRSTNSESPSVADTNQYSGLFFCRGHQ